MVRSTASSGTSRRSAAARWVMPITVVRKTHSSRRAVALAMCAWIMAGTWVVVIVLAPLRLPGGPAGLGGSRPGLAVLGQQGQHQAGHAGAFLGGLIVVVLAHLGVLAGIDGIGDDLVHHRHRQDGAILAVQDAVPGVRHAHPGAGLVAAVLAHWALLSKARQYTSVRGAGRGLPNLRPAPLAAARPEGAGPAPFPIQVRRRWCEPRRWPHLPVGRMPGRHSG